MTGTSERVFAWRVRVFPRYSEPRYEINRRVRIFEVINVHVEHVRPLSVLRDRRNADAAEFNRPRTVRACSPCVNLV